MSTRSDAAYPTRLTIQHAEVPQCAHSFVHRKKKIVKKIPNVIEKHYFALSNVISGGALKF